MSKTVAELEQEVESRKRRLAQLERVLGVAAGGPGNETTPDFGDLLGAFSDPAGAYTWEEHLAFKRELGPAFKGPQEH